MNQDPECQTPLHLCRSVYVGDGVHGPGSQRKGEGGVGRVDGRTGTRPQWTTTVSRPLFGTGHYGGTDIVRSGCSSCCSTCGTSFSGAPGS